LPVDEFEVFLDRHLAGGAAGNQFFIIRLLIFERQSYDVRVILFQAGQEIAGKS